MPVYGLAVGILGVIAAPVAKERRAILVSMLLVFVGAASAWPVASYGHRGYDRVYAMSGGDAQQWLDVHEERAEILVYLYYATAALAAVAFLFHWKTSRLAKPATWIVLLLALLSLGGAGWISHAGDQVRHSEFRDRLPAHPVEESKQARDHE